MASAIRTRWHPNKLKGAEQRFSNYACRAQLNTEFTLDQLDYRHS